MKLVILQEHLKHALSTVGRAVAGKSTLPVLANVLLSAAGGRLTLAATNLEIGITHTIGAQVEVDGAVTLPHKLFSDVVGSLPNDRVTLTLDERTQTVTIACGRFTSNIKGIEADEFPTIPAIDAAGATLPVDVLKQSIALTAFSAASDDSRPVLAGVLLELGDALTLSAADGFRLARHTTPIDAGDGLTCIVPGGSLETLGAILGGDTVTATLAPTGSQIGFTAGGTTLVSRLIEGKFPDVDRIIPQAHTTRLVVNRGDLAKAVKLASYFAVSAQGVVKLTVTESGAILSANASEVGDNTTEIECIVGGKPTQIALNAKYLAEVVGAIQTEQIAMELQTAQSPAVIKPVGSEGYVHIIMPMSLNR